MAYTIDDIYGSGKFLKHSDLDGQDMHLTITEVQEDEFNDGNKQLVLLFEETDKKFGLNKTNARTIADLYGPAYRDWPGKRISLFPTQTDFQGRQTPCVRVRLHPPKQGRPQPDRSPVRDDEISPTSKPTLTAAQTDPARTQPNATTVSVKSISEPQTNSRGTTVWMIQTDQGEFGTLDKDLIDELGQYVGGESIMLLWEPTPRGGRNVTGLDVFPY